ncbi:hypothetical protein K440DRAFT_566040, partial [Wilcoxina mikolae CBS 423.85]
YAFFVLMGGYVIHPGRADALPVTLTPRGFIRLYSDGRIRDEDLNPNLISDKAKADGLLKLVVCFQAIWFVAQGVGRAAAHLPIPLLELHTIMHVLCAVPMYIFWWHKPLDVRYPIFLNLMDTEEKAPASDILVHVHHSSTGLLSIMETSNMQSDGETNQPDLSKLSYRMPLPPLACNSFGHRVRRMLDSNSVDLNFADYGWHKYMAMYCSFAGLTMIYGVAHATAWNYQFPTPAERVLWRISATVAMFSCTTNMSLLPLMDHLVVPWVPSKIFRCVFMPISIILSFALLTAFAFGRTFLLVESFLSLRRLPKGSYDTVAWSDYWPHF